MTHTSWKNTPLKDFVCHQCGDTFQAKRDAKFCSPRCRELSRPERLKPTSEQRKEWYQKRCEKPGYREKLNRQGRARDKKVKDWINKYKLAKGCQDCGYSLHHVALDFDHVKGEKSINVCNAKSISAAKKEIEKCEVVCSNCHRIRTFNRLNKRRTDESHS